MDTLRKLFAQAAKEYNRTEPHYQTCDKLIKYCHQKLLSEASFGQFGFYNGKPKIPYSVFRLGESVSRPIRSDLYVSDSRTFHVLHERVIQHLREPGHNWQETDYTEVNRLVYTAMMSLACCFDLWQRSSRKTPGTFFEIFMAGLLRISFPEATLSKHISLAAIVDDPVTEPDAKGDSSENDLVLAADDDDEKASVSTDIVIGVRNVTGGVVIPLKITTRERIVQPFAHQRILDSAFGVGHYRSLIVCISETQLDDKTQSVKQVCVPGTIKLFQKYLAPIAGLYYCDLPQRYAADDMVRIISVRTLGHFFTDLRRILAEIKSQAKAG